MAAVTSTSTISKVPAFLTDIFENGKTLPTMSSGGNQVPFNYRVDPKEMTADVMKLINNYGEVAFCLRSKDQQKTLAIYKYCVDGSWYVEGFESHPINECVRTVGNFLELPNVLSFVREKVEYTSKVALENLQKSVQHMLLRDQLRSCTLSYL